MGNYPDRVSIYGEREYLVEIYDDQDRLERDIGGLTCFYAAVAAWQDTASRNPGKRVIMRHRARVIKNSLERD